VFCDTATVLEIRILEEGLKPLFPGPEQICVEVIDQVGSVNPLTTGFILCVLSDTSSSVCVWVMLRDTQARMHGFRSWTLRAGWQLPVWLCTVPLAIDWADRRRTL